MKTTTQIKKYALWVWLALSLLVSLPYLYAAFTTLPGRAIAPLDDAYITYQYARQIALGHPYQFNTGDAPSTGMTSPLFGYLLGGAYRLGATDERLIALALGLSVLWLALAAHLTAALTRRLLAAHERAPGPWPTVAGLLTLLSGGLQWASCNGMETGLVTVLLLAALVAHLDERPGWMTLWLALAGLARPEGLLLTLLIGALTLLQALLERRRLPWRILGLLTLALIAGLLPSFVNWLLTGESSAAGLQGKAWWYNVPRHWDNVILSILDGYQRVIFGELLGLMPRLRGFLPPFVLPLALLGWGYLARRRDWHKLALTSLWFFGGTLSTAGLITVTWHFGRYQAPFIPLLSAVAAVGLAPLTIRWRRPARQALVLALLLATTAWSTPALQLYRRSVHTVAHQQLALADWLRENIPPDARVGVHDTGALRYLGGHPTYDLVGLTTARGAFPWREGAGSTFEYMEHHPARPDYFAIYPDAFSIPYIAATDLFATALYSVTVADYGVTSAGPTQGIWRADWSLAGSGDQPAQHDIRARLAGLPQVDAVDLADMADEEVHGCTWWQGTLRPGFPTELWQLDYRAPATGPVLDGGRLLNGGLSCQLATEPGEPLWLVVRLHPQTPATIQVIVDGNPIGPWRTPAQPGYWLESLYPIPAIAITSERTTITLEVRDVAGGHYAPYYLWAYQGTPPATSPLPTTPLLTAFAAADATLFLHGYDLPATEWRPGDTLPLTLYWEAANATANDAKVFVHLYDESGALGPQADGWPLYETRPPYTWLPGEMIADPRQLQLPTELPAGRYTLAVGLYPPEGGPRLPIAGTTADYVILTTLTVAP